MSDKLRTMSRKRIWFNRIAGLAFAGVGLFSAYAYFSAGYHKLPDIPDGAFPLSFKNGFRAILQDIPDQRNTRKYLGYPLDAPFWAKEAWSYCKRPTKTEQEQILNSFELDPGSRLEAICSIQVDNELIYRGFVVSVPRL